MSDTQAPVTPQTPESAAPEKREIPSFQAEVAKGLDARGSELRELAGVKPAAPPAGPSSSGSTPAPGSEPAFDFEGEWGKLDGRLREGFVQTFYDTYNRALGEQYGRVLPLLVAAKENPELMAALEEAASKKELQALIANPKVRAVANKMTKSEIVDFLVDEAIPTYERYAPVERQPAPDAKDPRDARMEQIEGQLEQESSIRATRENYVDKRIAERFALINEFPQLAQDEKLQGHVIRWAEERFEASALRKGIDVTKEGWPARALKAGVRPPSYREGYQFYAEVSGKAAPPVAPGTSPAALPQAPRTPVEGKSLAEKQADGKKRGLEALGAKGGFNNLVTKLAERRRTV